MGGQYECKRHGRLRRSNIPLIKILGDDRGNGVGAILEKVIAENISRIYAKYQSSDSGSLINHKRNKWN